MYNDIIAGLTIAGTFFTAGYIGALWDFKKAQRKKTRERKLETAMEQYSEDIDLVNLFERFSPKVLFLFAKPFQPTKLI